MQHLQPNTTLQGGKYRIERVLGQGGFGITYLAVQTSLQRKVAIKEFFMKDFCSRDESTTILTSSTGSNKMVEQYKKKFIKEARNLARLHHPNIINVIDVFEENSTVYYTMPYLAGGSLQDYVKAHGPLSESEAMKYIRQIASALKYMHEEEHICHYDVKPANILLDDKDNAVLIDFGISKNYDAAGHETTTTPVGMSEGYAPIEQYQQNVEEFSPVSDVYALGATLYFLLHGKRPVSAVHRASGTALLMNKQLSQGIKDIINASMKISKRERAKSVDVFMGSINTSAYRGHTIVQDDESTILESAQRARKRNTTYTHPDTTSSATNTSNTERNSNSSIGWIIGIALACIVGFFLFQRETTIGKVDNGDNLSEQLPTENIKKEETSIQEKSRFNWSGNYLAEKDAGGTYGGTPIFFQTEFSLKRINDVLYEGTMEINGYQTNYAPAKIKGYVNGNRIRIYFVSSNDDGLNKWVDICNSDTPLLSLAITNGSIESEWYATLCESEVVDQSTPVIKQK